MHCLDFWTAGAKKAVDAWQVPKQLVVLTARPSREGECSALAELLTVVPVGEGSVKGTGCPPGEGRGEAPDLILSNGGFR